MKAARTPLIAAGVGIGVILLMAVGLILPKAGAVRSKQADVRKAKQQEETLRVELQQLQDDAHQAGAETRTLQRIQQQVPPTADLPGMIRSLNTEAVVSGVDFMTVTPGQPQLASDSKYSVVPVGMTLSGGYWAVDQFLYRLETLPRVATVSSISLSPTQPAAGTPTTSASGELAVTLTASFFTTDLSAGPGSQPGPTTQVAEGTTTGTTTGVSPVTSPSPAPTGSASSGG